MESIVKPNIGLSDGARAEVGQRLNLLLADEYVLYATTHDYHWNVTGPNFEGLHVLFETQYSQVHEFLDAIAERARAIGVGARGSWADLTKAARAAAQPGTDLPAEGMLLELVTLHEDLAIQLRGDVANATRLADIGTADFLTGLLEKHEKAAWMLRSHLQAREPVTA